MKSYKTEIGGKEIEFEIKGWAKKATGEVLVRSGETEVLVVATMSHEPVDRDYFPLMVFYEERFYARGAILGSRFMRREGMPSAHATLVSRIIDRSVRPLFNDEVRNEMQIIATCLSWDEENDPAVLGTLGASFALHLSRIPWDGPIGAVRVGSVDGELKLNPVSSERVGENDEILLCGVRDTDGKDVVINMIEMEGTETSKEFAQGSFDLALPAIKKLIELQEKARKDLGEEKAQVEIKRLEDTEKEVKDLLGDRLERALFSKEDPLQKGASLAELKREVISSIKENHKDADNLQEMVQSADRTFEKEGKKTLQSRALKGDRIDGRKLDEVREIGCEASPVKRVHGSGIFSRGLTTSLSVVALASPDHHQLIDGMEVVDKKRFMHHYNFPPYSVGEVRPLRSPGRRDIGHGMLGEKALSRILPSLDTFPYAIRIVSELLTSNGSTSMAAICSSSLALMDAGVPIKAPVAGIAIGIVQNEKEHKMLTDIQGPEDFYGGMDFKVAGTRDGINAIQLDVKIRGINRKIFDEALECAEKARLHILDKIEKEISEPRKELSPLAPIIVKTTVPEEKIGKIIGSGGKTIREIMERSDTEVSVEDNGEVFVSAKTREAADKGLKMIEQIAMDLKSGDMFEGKVSRSLPFGVIVDLCPGKDGLLHQSNFDKEPKVGDVIKVRVARVDNSGKVDLELQNGVKKNTSDNKRHGRGPNKSSRRR